MRTRACWLLGCALLVAAAAPARTVGDVEVPESLEHGATTLVLNGAGIRTRFFFEVYVAGLYLTQRSGDAESIVAGDEAMAIRLVLTSNLVTSKRLRSSTEAGFERSTHGETAPLRPQIEALMAVYSEAVRAGDAFDLVYVPGSGLEVAKNGVHQVTIDGGLRFKRAFFGIWLGDAPAQASLKRELLGR